MHEPDMSRSADIRHLAGIWRRPSDIHRNMLALFAAALLLVPTAEPSSAQQAVFVDGQAQIVPEFEDKEAWIREELWVETEFDSDVALLRRHSRRTTVPVGRPPGTRRPVAAARKPTEA